MNEPPNTVQQKLRNAVIDAVLFRLGQDAENSMPSDISADTRKAIIAETLPNSRFELSRLSTDELQNDRCIAHEIETAVEIARQFVVRIRKQGSRS